MFKKFMTFVMVMVCALSLCLFGCGDDMPKVFAGNYKEIDNQQIDTLLADISEKQGKKTDIDFTKGIDFSVLMEISGNEGDKKESGKIEYSLKTKKVEDDYVLSGKMFANIGDTDDNMDMEIYYANGYSYVISNKVKTKVQNRFNDIIDEFDFDELEGFGLDNSYDFESVLKQVKSLKETSVNVAGNNITFDKAQASIDKSDDQTKLKVELKMSMKTNILGTQASIKTDAVYYYLFDSDYNLIGMYINGTVETETTVQEKAVNATVKMNITAVPFDGDIKAPSDLDSYTLKD